MALPRKRRLLTLPLQGAAQGRLPVELALDHHGVASLGTAPTGSRHAAYSAATATGTASLKLNRDPLGSQFLNDSAEALASQPARHETPTLHWRGAGTVVDSLP